MLAQGGSVDLEAEARAGWHRQRSFVVEERLGKHRVASFRHPARRVQRILEAARLEAEAVQPSRELVDVGEIVERVAAVLTGDDCVVQVEEGLMLYADALHVQRIVTDLVSNALKYGAPLVTVSASRDGGTVRISCSDQGQGVPPAFVLRLFHKFARSEEAPPRRSMAPD